MATSCENWLEVVVSKQESTNHIKLLCVVVSWQLSRGLLISLDKINVYSLPCYNTLSAYRVLWKLRYKKLGFNHSNHANS